jgi:dTDP-4-dehydrorhamnose reductase
MKKRILITGANGLLGQKLMAIFEDEPEWELLATGRGELRVSNMQAVNYQPMDITSPNEVQRVFNEFRPEVVIHCAAMTQVDQCESDRDMCREINVTATGYLLRAAEKFNSHFVHISTDFIFDGSSGPYKETDLPNPLSYYGETKLAAELMVQAARLPWAILRTVLVYGASDGLSRSNIVLWAREALKAGKEISVVDDQFRSPTLAEDLAFACMLVAKKHAQGIYHISGQEQMSILEMVQTIAEFYGLSPDLIKPVNSCTLGQPAKRPPRTGFLLDKAKSELGYEPTPFLKGLELVEKTIKAMA